MVVKKKIGKNRQDRFYRMAKEQGYRARSAFKLIQLNRKYDFLGKSRCLVDLCAAPGGWCQVAAKFMPVSSLIIGVDLVPIKPMRNVITLVEDITTEKCRTSLRREMKHFKADCVLHDGAPNVGQNWNQDAYTQNALTLKALGLAVEMLSKGGIFVTKVFRSKDYNSLMWLFKQFFVKVEATKPQASRNESAEIFVYCDDFKAPDKIDPKFFDPLYVFSDFENQVGNRDIFHPERNKKAPALGYDEANGPTTFGAATAVDFITSKDAIDVLSKHGSLTMQDDESALYAKHPETTEEIVELCGDLRVLGKRAFRALLKWRSKMKEVFHKDSDDEESENGDDEDGETEMNSDEEDEEDLKRELTEAELERKREVKRKLRKERVKKRREQMRLAKGIDVDNTIDIDTEVNRELFGLGRIKTRAQLDGVTDQQVDDTMMDTTDEEDNTHLEEPESDVPSDMDSDEEFQYRREKELQNMYKEYTDRSGLARKKEKLEHKTKKKKSFDSGFDRDLDNNEAAPLLVTDLNSQQAPASDSAKATQWFDDDAFEDEEPDDDADADADHGANEAKRSKANADAGPKRAATALQRDEDDGEGVMYAFMDGGASGGGAQEGAAEESDTDDDLDDSDFEEVPEDAPRINADPEVLAMGQAMLDRKRRHEMEDDAYNRYAFADTALAPNWFQDNEASHKKRRANVTKAEVDEFKLKLKEIDSRGIKKVVEAKARKKMQSDRRLTRALRRASTIAENDDLSAAQKVEQMSKIITKGKKKVKREKPTTVVVRKGNSKGKGRPSGAGKGRYIAVDLRMKKELRAEKAKAKKSKKTIKR